MKHLAQSVLLAGVSALCACGGNTRAPELAKAEPVASQGASANELLAEARCVREARCNNIGPEKRYVSLDDCLARVWTEWQGDFDASECPAGIDEAALARCLTDIRVLECSSPLDSLAQLPACQSTSLCAG
jgi:hypothetical protein